MERDIRQIRKRFSHIGMVFCAFWTASFGGQFLIWTILNKTGVNRLISLRTAALVIAAGGMYLVGFPVYLLLMGRIPAQPLPEGTEKRLSPTGFAVSFSVCMGMVMAGSLLGRLAFLVISILRGLPLDLLLLSPGYSFGGNLALEVLLYTGIAPIVEELIFRKMLIDRIRDYGDRTAILISGLIFGLVCGNFLQLFTAFGMGMVLAYLYLRTGNVKNTILLRMAINLFVINMRRGLFLWGMVSFPVEILFNAYSALLVLCAFGGICMMVCLRNRRHFRRGEQELSLPLLARTAFGNVGMILLLAVCALSFRISIR
ncbi:hypothetical protein B5E84_00305 [Lachnoclostridium sp. An14]|uniref:CPBP family intramembrane glutamic endopeptidase n=1 Tax=Lachnoclostridium sp. An14 TaxID=1965562 RepID=UPI000B397ED5|nr:CPBP family intramembrane glutamic endopeptidase [Lachnoclostridium sp. An14]OUQ21742.1 hypothetical protein B5E84_00305 [Lachnoclostridium sp. An14]